MPKTTIVPVRLDEKDILALDLLVKSGFFRSRNEAIRAMVREGLSRIIAREILPDDVDSVVCALLRYNGRPFEIRSEKTAAELVREVRSR